MSSSFCRFNKLNYYQLVGNNSFRQHEQTLPVRGTQEGDTDMRTRRFPVQDGNDNMVGYAIAVVTIWTTVIVSAMALIH